MEEFQSSKRDSDKYYWQFLRELEELLSCVTEARILIRQGELGVNPEDTAAQLRIAAQIRAERRLH